MKNKIDQNLVIYLISVGVIIFAFLFLFSINMIGYSAKEKCLIAQAQYAGDCTGALISYLDDDANGYNERNSAIWALGQLGDERARVVLEKYYTGFDGGRCDRNAELSQLELKRALGYLNSSPNITTFFWRFGEGIDK